MINKRHCNGCIYGKFRAGISNYLAIQCNIDPHPNPTHYCERLGIHRDRYKYGVPRLKQCLTMKLAKYKEE